MMRATILGLLLCLSHSIFAACLPPDRFSLLDAPISAQTFPPSFQEKMTAPVQIINFWALWCAPCRVELPLFKQLALAGIPVLLVNIDDDEMAANQFLQQIQVQDLPHIQLENSDFLYKLGVTGFPATFLVENGALRYRTQGALKATDQEALQSYAACVSQP